MNPEKPPSPTASSSCPRCGSGSNNAFGFEGLCLRCAGVRVLEMESGTPWETDLPTRPLERVGPYEIIEELGHGGMGKVYAARQPGLGRIVAVKAIREGVNADLDLRFLREIETVARLRHPNIVSIHESGRAVGQLYFSMDYIEGGDLATRLRVDTLTPTEAATLMQKVAGALSYAHRQGILHRDLKPSNILLDGREPKLADFGLAAQIEAGGDLTRITRVLGTPHYLAPEAISGGSVVQGVASDIYSAGVILFEMLTGRTPFAGASSAELPALVRDSDAPPPRLLAPAVPRDLETICIKCLDRDPARRYGTADALAEDLGRFLTGEPVYARAASACYRVGRFVRRHRLAVSASALVAAALVSATVFSLWFAARARSAERAAAADSARSQAIESFLEHDILEQAAPDTQPDRDIKLRTVVERAAQRIPGRFGDQPEVELGLRETLAQTYESLGDFTAEEPQLERAIELGLRLRGPEDERTLADMGLRAQLLARTGRAEAGRKLLEDVIKVKKRVFGADAVPTLQSSVDLVFIDSQLGKIQEAEVLARDMVERCSRVQGPLGDLTLSAETDLSSMYFWEGKYPLAESTNRAVVDAFMKKLGPENPTTLLAMGNLAAVYASEDKTEEAQAMDERLVEVRSRVLGPDHPDTLRTLNNLGAASRENGRLDKAEDANLRCYTGRLKLLGPDNSETIMAETNLVWAKLEKGKTAEAEAMATQGYATALKASGPDHYATLGIASALAEVKRREGLLADAERLRAAVYASRLKKGGPENSNTLSAANALGLIEVQMGKFAEAEPLLRAEADGWRKTQPENWRGLVAQNLLGAALAGQHRFAEAEPLLVTSAESLSQRVSSLPSLERHEIADACRRVAATYQAWGRPEAALAWTQRAGGAPTDGTVRQRTASN
jgi:tetratricopeptide (TPR) repeat protein